MNELNQGGFCVAADDVRRYGWQELIVGAEFEDCRDYWRALQSEANRLESIGDDVGKRVFSLLAMVASFRAVYETKGCVYGEMYSLVNGNRSGNLDDLRDGDFTALAGVLEEISNPVFCARVACRRRKTLKIFLKCQRLRDFLAWIRCLTCAVS